MARFGAYRVNILPRRKIGGNSQPLKPPILRHHISPLDVCDCDHVTMIRPGSFVRRGATTAKSPAKLFKKTRKINKWNIYTRVNGWGEATKKKNTITTANWQTKQCAAHCFPYKKKAKKKETNLKERFGVIQFTFSCL